jgi:Uma2 family endonuclease
MNNDEGTERELQYMTVDEWRKLERATLDAKYEYIDGQVYLVSGGSLVHSRISSNAVRALEDALAGGPCYVYNADAYAYIILSSLPVS